MTNRYQAIFRLILKGHLMHLPVSDRVTADAAASLMASHGALAGQEAAARADVSRNQGNITLFCRWRQVERLIVALSSRHSLGTIH